MMFKILRAAFCLILLTVPALAESDCSFEKKLIQHSLIDINTIDSTILVELVNSSTMNMLGEDLYGCLTKAYLQPQVAQMVVRAQKRLQAKHPSYSLKILDATRPRSVQKKMWAKVKGTSLQHYVANPKRGSMHNYGAAVDITIVDGDKQELAMGEPDIRTPIIGKTNEQIQKYLNSIKLTERQKENRQLLKGVLVGVGFYPLKHEWWHFRAFSKEKVRRRFKIVE